MNLTGKITWVYIISLVFNLLIPLMIVRIISGDCTGDCHQYLIPVYTLLLSFLFYIPYCFLPNDKMKQNERLKLLLIFAPSLLFLLTTILSDYDFLKFTLMIGITVIPNLILNYMYYKKLT